MEISDRKIRVETVFDILNAIHHDKFNNLPDLIEVDAVKFKKNNDDKKYYSIDNKEYQDYDLFTFLEENYHTDVMLDIPVEIIQERIIRGWRAKKGEEYWFVDENGEGNVYREDEDGLEEDDIRYYTDNYFQTEEQAIIHLNNLLTYIELKKLAEELNNGEKIDWENLEQKKYFIILDCYADGSHIIKSRFTFSEKIGKAVYCLDEKFLDKAINKIGGSKLTKLFVEE